MRWDEVWAAKRLEPAAGSTVLERLIAADGYDTPFGRIAERDWLDFVRRCAQTLGIARGCSVFEVGCGAGAFLYELYRGGCQVAGIDLSPALVQAARELMPEGRFEVAEAAALQSLPQADFVVSCGVFFYFPSLQYAREVLKRMVLKARRGVLILDLPDAARKEQALAARIAAAGGPEAYARRYAGLDHLYFERDWMAAQLRELGLRAVQTAAQRIGGYPNGEFRFNAWGRR